MIFLKVLTLITVISAFSWLYVDMKDDFRKNIK